MKVSESQLRNVILESGRRLKEAAKPKEDPRVTFTVEPHYNHARSRVTLIVGGTGRYVYKIHDKHAVYLAGESKPTSLVPPNSPEMITAAVQVWLQCTGQGDGYFIRDYRRALGPDGYPHPQLPAHERMHILALRALDPQARGYAIATNAEVAAQMEVLRRV